MLVHEVAVILAVQSEELLLVLVRHILDFYGVLSARYKAQGFAH